MPTPDDRIPVEYVNMFLTDDMIENLVLESNKYATETTESCPNFTKTELYYLMGIVRLQNIDDYWRFDLRYAQIADRMSHNKLHSVWQLRPWIENLQTNSLTVSPDDYQLVDEIMVSFKGRSILKMHLPQKVGNQALGSLFIHWFSPHL
jgi:hypothetical protein